MLFHICGDIDIKATLVSNIFFANPLKGMQVMLNQPRVAQASQFADIVRMTLELAKEHVYTNTRSSLILIRVIHKILATEKVTSLKLKANSVEPSIFLPQGNKCLINRKLTNEMTAILKDVIDCGDPHKTKVKAITHIGSMLNMNDFSSLCINMDTIIAAICFNYKPQHILHQILLNFVSIINSPEWVRSTGRVGSMPLLHWYCYSFLERIFNCFADFAADFGNGNIMSESCPIAEVNTKALVGALTVIKAFSTPSYRDPYCYCDLTKCHHRLHS